MSKINQIIANQITFFILSFFFLTGVCFSQDHQGEENDSGKAFNPVHFERVHSVIVNTNADSVFKMLGPRSVNKQGADFLYGNEEEFEGSLFRIYNQHGHWDYYSVGKYDLESRIYRTTIFMPETELWINEYNVEPLGSGKSKLTVRWRITGYHKNSNDAIQGFIDHDLKQKLFVQSVIKVGQKIEDFFKNRNK